MFQSAWELTWRLRYETSVNEENTDRLCSWELKPETHKNIDRRIPLESDYLDNGEKDGEIILKWILWN